MTPNRGPIVGGDGRSWIGPGSQEGEFALSALQVAVNVTSLALVATKFFDCLTTSVHMQGPSDEANPLARAAMMRFGPRLTIWAVSGVVVMIVAIVGVSAHRAATDLHTSSDPDTLKLFSVWGYIVLGLLISLVQAAVAQKNGTGEFNVISRAVLSVTSLLTRW